MPRRKALALAAAFAVTLFLGSVAVAQNDESARRSDSDTVAPSGPCYTLASISGAYAVVAHYQGDLAFALGVRSLDGKGNLTGTFVLNEPVTGSTTGARKIVTGTQEGTYTVNCNGSGVITRVLTTGTTKVNQLDNFIITGGRWVDGQLIATSIQDVQETSSALVAGGLVVTRVWTLLPQ